MAALVWQCEAGAGSRAVAAQQAHSAHSAAEGAPRRGGGLVVRSARPGRGEAGRRHTPTTNDQRAHYPRRLAYTHGRGGGLFVQLHLCILQLQLPLRRAGFLQACRYQQPPALPQGTRHCISALWTVHCLTSHVHAQHAKRAFIISTAEC
jgi:hypothetical protein